MKKLKVILVAMMMACSAVFAKPAEIKAENPPSYDDDNYWEKKCLGKKEMTPEDKKACDAYSAYLEKQKQDIANRKKDLDNQMADILANLEKYNKQHQDLQNQIKELETQIAQLQSQIDVKQAEINAKQAEIDTKQQEIDAKQVEIDATQADIDALEAKLKHRMSDAQLTMRTNKYIDILMGASSFEELLRILNGLNSIAAYDQETMQTLSDLKDLLNEQKAQMEAIKQLLEQAKAEMEAAKQELKNQQSEIKKEKQEVEVKKYAVEKIERAYEEKYEEIEAEGNKYAANISQLNKMIRDIANTGVLEKVVTSGGWTHPVPGARRSAGTWHYASGASHLGYDFARAAGSPVYAAANGVVLNSVNGCPTYGGLGTRCGHQYGGTSGGGNQLYLLVTVGDKLYGMRYLHLMLNSPVKAGTVVKAGQQIAKVGSSGNSSGPHCHIEIIYLGSASNFSYYAQHWNGDLAFGAGWKGYDRKCDAGYGAPCRIRPESIFGY
ncbi:MAG: peptidoglycan DD-metalloendopeptidase family protein [Solobacterium sp.]|nr:peptidoglycan DD-metalloendopeptidase family protein [Solobacterium sp.]